MDFKIMTINLGSVNCYLVKTELGFILVDSGGCTVFDIDLPSIRTKLVKALENAGCGNGDLKLVLLTHGDIDHCGNCAFLREKYGAKIGVHPSDADLVEKGETPKKVKFKPFFLKIIFNVLFGSKLKKTLLSFERFKPDFYIDEDFELTAFGFDAKIIHIPGHTDGSIGILTSRGELICGDTLCNNGKPSLAPNACDFKELNRSIEKLKKLNIITVYPGHGQSFPMKSLSL